MRDARQKLHKDVNAIFNGVDIPERVAAPDSRRRLHKDIRTMFNDAGSPEEATGIGSIKALSAACPTDMEALADRRREDIITPVKSAAPVYRVKDDHIQALLGRVKCAKDHVCYHSGFQTLCKARSLLGGRIVECLERGQPCSHRFSFLSKAFCRCAIRQYIASKLGG